MNDTNHEDTLVRVPDPTGAPAWPDGLLPARCSESSAVPTSPVVLDDLTARGVLADPQLRQPDHVLRTAASVRSELDAWSRAHPGIAGARGGSVIPWISLHAAVSYRGAPYPVILEFARTCTALFAYDDVLDGDTEDYGPGGPQGFADACLDALETPRGADRPPLPEPLRRTERAVAEVASRCARHPFAADYRGPRRASWRNTFDAMAVEADWRSGRRPRPGLEEYLANGSHSIGMTTAQWSALMVAGPGFPGHAESAAFVAFSLRAARCVRVANDLHAHEREDDELNAVALAAERWSCSGARAGRRLTARLEGRLGSLCEEALDATGPLADHVRWTARLTLFSCQWYVNRLELSFEQAELISPG